MAQIARMMRPRLNSDRIDSIYSFFSDELRMGLFISKHVVELCGGNLDLIFDDDLKAIKIVFSFHMKEPEQEKSLKSR